MKVINYATAATRPEIVQVIEFSPWPFKTSEVETSVGFLSAYAAIRGGHLREPEDECPWQLNTLDNCLVIFDDGTVAVGCQKAVDAYNKSKHKGRMNLGLEQQQ